MTIETRNVPSSSEILEYVPSSTYIKNQSTSNRRINIYAPDTNNLKGNYVAGTVASFSIPYSTNSLLNLSESYFNVNGVMDAYLGTNPAANGSTFGKIKAGPLWLLPMIQKATLEIGGCAVYNISQPFRLAKLKQMMSYDYNDMMNQTLEYQNIPPYDKTLSLITLPIYTGTMDASKANLDANRDFINNTTVAILGLTALTQTFTNPCTQAEYAAYCNEFNTNIIGGFNTKYGTTIGTSTYTSAAVPAVDNEAKLLLTYFNAKIQEMNDALNSFNSIDLLCTTNVGKLPSFQKVHEQVLQDSGRINDRLKFQQYIKLSDIFPVETMKPIFGQTVRIILNFESSGFVDVQVNKNVNVDNLQVSYFNQFVLNAISYTINVDLQSKLNQIYSKPVLEIIDDITIWDGPLQFTLQDSSIPIRVPIDVLFECDFVGIGLPESVSGSYQMKETFTDVNANFTNHNISDFRFFNIQKIEVTLDNEVVYYHDFTDMSANGTSGNVIPFISKTNDGTNPIHVDINNFIPLYELYKECRWSFGRDEKGCIPYNDFLTSGFIIPLPMSAFSRISTNSQLNVNLTMGKGVVEGKINVPSMTQIKLSEAQIIDRIRVITKGKRGLMFERLDRCSLYNIQQSFDQDINVTESKE